MSSDRAYAGRFAPSPSGPLHHGSLIAAVASYLDARANSGRWHLRIDDIDTPRTVPGADRAIIAELNRLGLEHDGPIQFQSERLERYRSALASLRDAGGCFDCGCTRREVAGGPYPGTCANGLPPGREPRSVRVRVPSEPVTYLDVERGLKSVDLNLTSGHFVIRRADGLFAYHLASVLDDDDLGVTHVVRGEDLEDSAAPQTHLANRLQLHAVSYRHVPLVMGPNGRKLSKQNHAPATLDDEVIGLWRQTLQRLSLDPPAWQRNDSLQAIKRWAVEHWRQKHGEFIWAE